jgi:adenylyltransferase/sulfurtransferase
LKGKMPSYRDILRGVKSRIREMDVRELNTIRTGAGQPVVIDVREQDEVEQGIIPGAIHIPRGFLESRVEQSVPDLDTPVVAYCAAGARSAFAAETLQQMGYRHVTSLKGGFGAWKDAGFKFVVPRELTPQQQKRYSRHVLIPEIGKEGQLKLLDSKVLIIGAGGLGSPAGYYLAAAGVGTIGIVDSDVVDESNLQRQILHNSTRIGEPKVESAKKTLEELNPDVKVIPYRERLTRDNVLNLFGEYDLIVDGSDNFPTRYLVNDASVLLRKTVVHGSIFRFDGQVSVFKPFEGPCYRCVFPEPPPPELAPTCDEAGTLGVLPGIVGLFEANEAVKLLLGIGEPLIGRLLMIDALAVEFRTLRLKRDPNCPVCGEHKRFSGFVDYEVSTAIPQPA